MRDIQSSFAGGEIAPDLQSRVDIQKYKTSLATLRNMIPNAHGAAYRRPGTYLVGQAKLSDTKCRLVPFVFSTSDAYVLEFGDYYIRFYKNGSRVMSGPSIVELVTPFYGPYISGLKFAQSADTIYIASPLFAPRRIRRFSDTNWVLDASPWKNGPFMFPNTDTSKILSFSQEPGHNYITSDFDAFTPQHVGSLWQTEQFYGASNFLASKAPGGDGTFSDSRGMLGVPEHPLHSNSYASFGGGWKLRTSGTWTGTLALQKSYDQVTWKNIRLFSSAGDVNYSTFGVEDISLNDGNPFYIRPLMTFHSAGTITVEIDCDPFNTYSVALTIGYVNSRKMEVSSSSPGFGPTSLWSEGSWSAYRGFPSEVCFVQDRLTYSSTTAEPQTIWFSKTSNYQDFGRSIPLVDSDGISVNLLSRELNPINSLLPFLNNLLSFTESSEWAVTSESGGVLTPSTVRVKLQGTRGTGSVDPIIIGNRIIFIEPRGSAVRDMAYQYFTDTFESENISTLSDHLFKGYSIVAMAYQQEPDSILWLVRSDGALLSLTYLREQEVVAWSRHDTQGQFEWVTVIPGSNGDEVWFAVKRGANRFIERMLPRTTSTDPADQYYVDCGISYTPNAGDVTSVSSLSGYDHLNGLSVAINAGGRVLPQQVIASGTVTLDGSYSKVHVGLPYISDIETLNPEFPLKDGTLQGRKYQIARATLRLLNTVGGQVGSDPQTLDPLNYLTVLPQPTQSVPLEAVAKSIVVGSGASSRIGCGGVWNIVTTGAWTGNIAIELTKDNGATWIEGKHFFSNNDVNFNEYGTIDVGHIRINIYAFTSGSLFVTLTNFIPTPLFTGFTTNAMPRNDDQTGHVAFRQSDPMPATLLSIMPEVDPGENP